METYLLGVVASVAFAAVLRLIRIHETLRKIEENTRREREREGQQAGELDQDGEGHGAGL